MDNSTWRFPKSWGLPPLLIHWWILNWKDPPAIGGTKPNVDPQGLGHLKFPEDHKACMLWCARHCLFAKKNRFSSKNGITRRFDVNNQDINISLGYDWNFSWDLEPPKNHGFVPAWERKNKRSPIFGNFLMRTFGWPTAMDFFRYCIILPNMSVVKGECQTP